MIESVSYVAGVFIAVKGSKFLRSPDGVTWVNILMTPKACWFKKNGVLTKNKPPRGVDRLKVLCL